MKNLIITLTITLLTATMSFASVDPVAVISTETVEVVNMESSSIFSDAEFNTVSENLEFETKNSIDMIQIYDVDGNMTFQLPVQSNNVKINKNLFDKGVSKLGFLIKGSDKAHYTSVKIN